jgi:hypothetical protein
MQGCGKRSILASQSIESGKRFLYRRNKSVGMPQKRGFIGAVCDSRSSVRSSAVQVDERPLRKNEKGAGFHRAFSHSFW